MHMDKDLPGFSHDEMAAAIQIWSRAAVSVLDIRHNLLSPEESLCAYRLPASAFLYTSGGKTEVLLDDTPYQVERFGLFHGGSETKVTIRSMEHWVEYYMVLYKAGEPPFQKKEYFRMLETTNPFRQQYGFSPEYPVFIAELLRKMYEKWKGPVPLNVFYGKTAFYQLVYEVYEELARGPIFVLEPDVIAMAKRYIDEHYNREVNIQTLCATLGVSYSSFYKAFKEKNGEGPQEYLIDTRLCAAKDWLKNSDMPMRKIAEVCGFSDERSFYRLFAKRMGISPNAYRQNSPDDLEDNAIGNLIPFPYNWEGQVSVDELKGKGAPFMLKPIRSKVIVAAALCLMLLMTACSTVPDNTSGMDSTSIETVATQAPGTEVTQPVEKGTRTVSTVMGDVEVPRHPARIVESGYWRGDILALGVTPVATQNFYTRSNAYSDRMEGIAVLDKWEAENIMAMEPDLIITGSEDDFEKFGKIAPTIVIPWGTPVEERLPLIAQALGQEVADAEVLIEEYRKKVEDYRTRLEKTGILNKSMTVFRNDGFYEGAMELGGSMGWGGEVVYALFDMPMPEAVEKYRSQENWNGAVSFEVIPELCGDYILVNQSPEMTEEMESNSIWQSIPAVQKGNVIVVEPGKIFFPDIITDTYKLELIAEALLELASNQ